ncbi:MAG: ribonuclease HII [Alphaproteobacteria bacterium]|nr:ribonuclease HII [Alphaproteobacteria bacterium]
MRIVATIPPTRSRPDFSRESAAGGLVAGIDEAGRGPLAGPVVAAAVILDPAQIPPGLNDSKLLPSAERERLYRVLRRTARIGVGAASVGEIDRLNILWASMLAMQRAAAALIRQPGCRPNLILVDGNRVPALPCPAAAVVDGDALCLSVAAASVVAKVIRDRVMTALDRAHSGYGWDSNRGYATEEHRLALLIMGPTPHHRRSFAP